MVPVAFPDPSSLGVFAVAALALLAIPGPAVLYVVVQSAEQGRRAGLASVAGIHIGTLVHVIGAAAGLSALIVASALAFSVVKYAGAAYLLYLGVRKLLEGDTRITFERRAGAAWSGVCTRHRRQRAQPEDGPLLPRVPTAVHRR